MIRSLTMTTAPTREPLIVEDLRRHLRVDTAGEDFLLEQWLVAARRHVEAYTGAAIMSQSWEVRLDEFPDETRIELPRNPVSAVASVQYVDNAGALQTMSAADYDLVSPADPIGGIFAIGLGFARSWPAARGHFGDVRIAFTAGAAERKDVPPELLAAILLIAADLHENREAQGDASSFAPNPTVRRLLAPFRRRWFAT